MEGNLFLPQQENLIFILIPASFSIPLPEIREGKIIYLSLHSLFSSHSCPYYPGNVLLPSSFYPNLFPSLQSLPRLQSLAQPQLITAIQWIAPYPSIYIFLPNTNSRATFLLPIFPPIPPTFGVTIRFGIEKTRLSFS